MSSSIFFRFKSSKEPMQINFDGTSLSVFEVKREIINISRFGDGKDFDLEIFASDSSEVYDDDTTQIPRSTTVIASRRPAAKPGAGRAARYVTGHMPSYAKNQHRVEKGGVGKSTPMGNGGAVDQSNMTEEEKLQAVMNASNTQLKADLESSATMPVKRNTYKPAAVPDKPLPPGYVCYRCRKKGHWIQACPTNNDPTFDGKKPKRTTGIPRSMLEKVEEPDTTKELPPGVFMTNDGDYVRVKTDEATWQKIQDQQKATAEKAKELARGDAELRERGLECMLDKRPFVNPVQTPCCHTTYCQDCIENALLDNDLLCPNCGEQALLDKLEPDDKKVKELADYEKEKKAEKQQKEKEKSKSPGPSKREDTKSPSGQAKTNGTGSPSPSPSKKRGAEEELENKRRPSNPAEMKKTASNQGTPAPGAKPGPSKPEPPKGPKAMTGVNTNTGNTEMDFKNLMNSMSMPGAQNGMNAMMNPMMMNGGMPNFMGGPMGMGMGPMMPGMMPNFNMMNGMGFPNMAMNGGMNGMGNMGMNGNMGWQGNQQQQQQPWMNGGGQRNGPPTGPAAEQGAYFRQPVNPHRHQNKQRRQRSVDYKQM